MEACSPNHVYTPIELQALYARTIIRNPWMIQTPHRPRQNPRQTAFLAYLGVEAMYGGAAGGGKSSALLMAAAQFVEVPGYAALILRKTLKDLNQPGALIPRSKEWWGVHTVNGQRARWSNEFSRWTFPSGASITFGYLDKKDQHLQYQGSEFQFIGFDELTQFPEAPYRYLFSRLRRPSDGPLSQVPLRMRAASNPGGPGADWVGRRFVPSKGGKKFFVPAFLKDNAYLDALAYIRSMANMTAEQRKQLLSGSWDELEGGRFKRDWFFRPGGTRVAHAWWTDYGPDGAIYVRLDDGRIFPAAMCWTFIVCDPAASEKDAADHTAIGAFLVTPDFDLCVLEVVREKLDIDAIVPRIADLCKAYDPTWVGIESVGFQMGILRQAQRHEDIPACKPFEPEGKGKLVRATPAIIRASNGQIFLPDSGPIEHPWIDGFVGELVSFTGQEKEDAADDQVDMLAYAVQGLERWGMLGGPVVVDADEELMDAEAEWGSRNGYYSRQR